MQAWTHLHEPVSSHIHHQGPSPKVKEQHTHTLVIYKLHCAPVRSFQLKSRTIWKQRALITHTCTCKYKIAMVYSKSVNLTYYCTCSITDNSLIINFHACVVVFWAENYLGFKKRHPYSFINDILGFRLKQLRTFLPCRQARHLCCIWRNLFSEFSLKSWTQDRPGR